MNILSYTIVATSIASLGRLKKQADFEHWQLSKVAQYDLTLRLMPNSISAVVFHAGSARAVVAVAYEFDLQLDLQEYKEQLQVIISKHEWLQPSSYSSVKIATGWGGATFVPQELYTNADEANLLDLSLGKMQSDYQAASYKHQSAAVSLFYAPAELLDFLQTQYRASRIKLMHTNSVFAQQLLDMSAATGPAKLALLVEKGYLTVVITKGKAWQLVNRYNIKTPVDISYFTVLAAQETGLDIASLPVTYYGTTESNAEWVAALSKYATVLGTGNLPSAWSAHGAAEADLAPWFATFAMTSCV